MLIHDGQSLWLVINQPSTIHPPKYTPISHNEPPLSTLITHQPIIAIIIVGQLIITNHHQASLIIEMVIIIVG